MKKLKSLKYILAITTALFVSATTGVWGVDYTWDGNSDGDGDNVSWNDPNNWDTFGIPGQGDTVTFGNTATPATVTLSSNVSIDSLTFDTSNVVTLNLNGRNIALSDTLNIGSSLPAHPGVNVIIIGSGTINCDTFDTNNNASNTLHLSNSVNIVVTNTLWLNQGTGTTNFYDDDATCSFTVPGGSSNAQLAESNFFINTLSVAPTGPNTWIGTTADWGDDANWTYGMIPVSGNDVLIPQVTAPSQYPVLNVPGIAANVTIAIGAHLSLGSQTLTVSGMNIIGTGYLTAATGTLDFASGATWLCDQPVNSPLYDVTTNGAGTASSAMIVTHDWTRVGAAAAFTGDITFAGTSIISGNTTTFTTATISTGHTLEIANGAIATTGALTNNGTVTIVSATSAISAGSFVNGGSSEVVYQGITTSAWGPSYNIITLDNAANLDPATIAGGTLSAVSLSVSATAILDLDTSGVALSVTGATANDGTITGDGTRPITFGGNYTGNAASATLTASGTNTYFRGIATDLRGTLNAGTGTVTFDGSANQTLTPPAASAFNILTVNKTSGDFTVNANALDCASLNLTTCVNATFNTAITATSISQLAGTGTTSFHENVTTSGALGIKVTAATINLDELTMTAGTDPAALIEYHGNVTLTTGPTSLNAIKTILVDGPVSGPQALTVETGAALGSAITFAQAVGSPTPLDAITVTNGYDVTFQNNVTTSGLGGINVTAANIITLDELSMRAETDPAARIELHGNVTLTTGLASLYAEQTILVDDTVSGPQPLTLRTGTAAGSAITFNNTIGIPAPLGAITVTNGLDVTFNSTVAATSLTQSAGSGTTTFISNVTTTGAVGIDITTSNINLDGLTMSAGTNAAALIELTVTGNVTLTTGPASLYASQTILVDGAVEGPQSLTAKTSNALGSVITFEDTLGATTPLADITVADVRNAIFRDNVTTSGLNGIAITATTINLDGLTMTAGTDPAASIDLTGAVTLTGGPVNLYARQTIYAHSTVSGAQNLTVETDNTLPSNNNSIIFATDVGTAGNEIGTGTGNAITVNGTGSGTGALEADIGACKFYGPVRTRSGIFESDDSRIIFKNDITQIAGGAAPTDSVFNGNVTFTNAAALTYTSVRNITFGNADTDAVTINGTNSVRIQTTAAANGNIIFNAPVTAVNAANSLIITNAGRFQTNEDADINLTAGAGSNFTQNGAGLNQLAGDILTTSTLPANGTITFATDVYLFGTSGDSMVFSRSSTSAPITFSRDLHIAASGKTINFASRIEAQNVVLYAGIIDFVDTLIRPGITTSEDLVLLGGNYRINDLGSPESGVNALFAYDELLSFRTPSVTPGANPNATIRTVATFPDGSPNFPRPLPATPTYSGSFNPTNLRGKTIAVGENFYANGITLEADALPKWTLSIPDNSASQNFAEAYWVDVGRCTATSGVVSAAEGCNDLHSTPPDDTTGWDFSRPTIVNIAPPPELPTIETYTVYDNVIRVRFSEPIENSNNEISKAFPPFASSITYYDGTGLHAFTGAFFDEACTDSTNGKGDIDTFYLQTTASRWNTDATGTSAGAADSTDRGRGATAPTPQTSIPCIDLPKALDSVYATLRDSHKNRVAHYHSVPPFSPPPPPPPPHVVNFSAGATYTAVTDHCRPVLAAVYTGQEAHVVDSEGSQRPYDAHNFIELRWSEAVTIDSGAIPVGAVNMATTNTVGGITPWGLGLEIAGFGRIQNGSLSTRKRLYGANSSTPDNDTVHAIYRTFLIATVPPPPLPLPPAPSQTHRMRISIAGFSESQTLDGPWVRYWPSYIENADSPSGAVTELPIGSRLPIQDTATVPNNLERIDDTTYAKATINVSNTPAGLYGPWDTTPPCLAARRSSSDGWTDMITSYEAVPAASGGIISRLELHFLDNAPNYSNPLAPYAWWSKTGWGDAARLMQAQATAQPLESFGGSRQVDNVAYVTTSGGIRESTLYGADTNNAFTVNNTGSVIGSINPNAIGTEASTPFMNPAPLDPPVSGDPYIRLMLATTWPINGSELYISYNQALGYITDLAGNLLPSFTNLPCLDRSPLHMAFTLAGVGRQDLFVLFSKDLDLSATLPFLQNGLEVNLNGTLYTPDGLSLVRGNPRALLFHLSTPVTAEDLVNPLSSIRITQNGALTYVDPDSGGPLAQPYFVDTDGNYALVGATHALTNIGIGLVNILYGADNVNKAGLLSATEGALRANGFNGTGRLLDSDITLATQLNLTTAPDALTVYFDVKPPPAMMPESYNAAMDASNALWLPSVITGFNTQGNSDARALSPTVITDVDRLFRNFLIPESDPEIVPGSKVELIMQYGGLYCARLTDSADITSIAPWSFVIAETRRQRGGVTILNNVINVNNREKVIVQVDVPSSGNIVIQVFTLDGNVVKILDRGKRGGGTYQYFWDGTNGAGNPVTRGLYFIRVVGPDMDEIRKVMVVKD